MAWQQGVNLSNILRAAFFQKSVLHIFSLLTVYVCIFLIKEMNAKAACKMLVKFNIGVKSQ